MKIILLTIALSIFSSSAFAKIPHLGDLLKESNTLDWKVAVTASVIIKAPIHVVWKYASDSSQAVNWSVYFDHISSLPGKYPDGHPGSLRRCFRNKDESGEFWDEVIIDVEPLKTRKIVTYNFTNYPMKFFYENEYVFVRQIYRAIDQSTSELTFQTVSRSQVGFIGKLLFYLSRRKTLEIFELNLENIKHAIEGKPRKHPLR